MRLSLQRLTVIGPLPLLQCLTLIGALPLWRDHATSCHATNANSSVMNAGCAVMQASRSWRLRKKPEGATLASQPAGIPGMLVHSGKTAPANGLGKGGHEWP